MSENSASRKMLSLVLLAAGAAGMVIALILDFSGSGNTMRGPPADHRGDRFSCWPVLIPDSRTSPQHY